MIAALKKRPFLRDQYAFDFVASDSVRHEEAFLTLSVIWHRRHCDGAARVSLHSTTLDDLAERAPFHSHARCKLHVGESIRLQLGTLASP
ncbi:hypothetical protein [Ralstonia syzygii]|uniref:hypothetical protein n=1 Tax=Ralstonia syzygii TaxID=28097 RepID=UPI001E491A4F|nr:hypothetical protein [Ralstonia syzygii]